MHNSENITLIGMPGAGKSTLGIVLAKKLGLSFVDTDLLIQHAEGKLLSELIDEHGPDGFVNIENALLSCLDLQRHVIATGGSAVYGTEAMSHVKTMGPVVYLELSFSEIKDRLHDDLLARGVVIHKGSTLADLYAERIPLYEAVADVTVNLDGLSTFEAVNKLYSVIEGKQWKT